MRRGGEGRPGKGKHVVLIAADQEYRCEQAMPMLALILFTRLISLSLDQEKHIEDYFDSGKPIIALRTSNHGFEGKLDYKINDQQVTLSQIFGGSLPEGCRALVYGQPLIGRGQGGTDNPEKEPLPVVWFKNWKTSTGKEAAFFIPPWAAARILKIRVCAGS